MQPQPAHKPPPDLAELGDRLAAISNSASLAPAMKATINEAAEALRQGKAFVASIPLMIQERTAMVALNTSMKCAAILNVVAKDYEDGVLPMATPATALRKIADALVLSQQEIAMERAGLQPKRKKSKLIGVG